MQDGLALTATIRAEEAGFLVEGELNGLLRYECVRCLEAFATPAALSFRALYKDRDRRCSKREEREIVPGNSGPEETDCHPVVEQKIALQEMLRRNNSFCPSRCNHSVQGGVEDYVRRAGRT